MFGGYNYGSTAYSSKIFCYDTETGTNGSVGVSMPKSAGCKGCCAIGSKIYVVDTFRYKNTHPPLVVIAVLVPRTSDLKTNM